MVSATAHSPHTMMNDDLFLAVRGPNPLEDTIERVTGAIKARLLSPGERLPAERELAVQLGVSRSTLRAALQTLTDAGWIEVRRGRHGGSFVAKWPHMPHPRNLPEVLARYHDELPSLLDYRRAVETAAALFAAERATADDVDELEATNTALASHGCNFEAYRTADARFHIGVARAAHSPRIMQAVTEIESTMSEVLDVVIYQTTDVMDHAARQHAEIIAAIRAHQPNRAHTLMLDHVRATEEIIYNLGRSQKPGA